MMGISIGCLPNEKFWLNARGEAQFQSSIPHLQIPEDAFAWDDN